MYNKIFLGLLITCALFSINLQAATQNNRINYSFAEIRFVDKEFGDVDGDGFKFGGSYQINNELYVLGSYTDLDLDFRNEVDLLEIGGGIILPQQGFDATVEFTYIDSDINDNSENGWSLSGGARKMFKPNIEVRAYLRHLDIVDSDTFIELGGDYFFNKLFSIGVTLNLASDDDQLTFGGRYYF